MESRAVDGTGTCPECGLERGKDIYRHLSKVHSWTKDRIDSLKIEKRSKNLISYSRNADQLLQCECGLLFTTAVCLAKHQNKKDHGNNYRTRDPTMTCPLCECRINDHMALVEHVGFFHTYSPEEYIMEEIKFDNKRDFEQWKSDLEEKTIARFAVAYTKNRSFGVVFHALGFFLHAEDLLVKCNSHAAVVLHTLHSSSSKSERMGASSGLVVAGIAGATALGISFAAIPFVAPALRRVCIPYVPATPPQLKNLSRALAEHTPKQGPLIDLGSGDGRVMKFGEQLASHLTPEWRKQYIDYEAMKSLLYDNMLEVPSEEDRREEHIAQMDEKFFNECDNELTKINLFFSQKIAEAQGKYHELQSELTTFKEVIQMRTEPTTLRRRFGAKDKLHKETVKTSQQLKLAFSEFYLSLVLVQNYQQLNATGFRKILKKHDKLTGNERGLDWRINKVEKSSFFLNREIETLINNVETSVINELEGGNRQAGMKRLKVPPLSEKQKPVTTFSLGLFMGASVVLILSILLSWWAADVRPNEPQWVAVRLFRGPFLLFLSIFMCGVNMAGWAGAGVNHVLIFEVDPRHHLSYQTLMQIAAFMIMLWSCAVLAYVYAHLIHIPPFAPPLVLMIICAIIMFNPLSKPDYLFHKKSRWWLIQHCYKCFTAPLHFVTFADFWLGDQMNSLTTSFLDFQYFLCFYSTEVDYSPDNFLAVRTINSTTGAVPWGYVDISTGKDMCMSASGVRSFVSIIPATVRFMQCLRRYRDTKRVHPHLINAGKYSTTYLVVACGALNKWAEKSDPNVTSPFFYIWIASYILSFTYTFLWDIFMDWGLIDPRAPKEAPFLREEMIYGSKFYYYGAIVQDFVLRLAWVLNVSLGEAWTLDSDFLTTLTAPAEVFRRFVWNYFRLENEHVNNCGQFRAVRDISVKPIRKGDLESLLSKMDQCDGVTHRGHDLVERHKKHKKAQKSARTLLRKARNERRLIVPFTSAATNLVETQQ